MDYITSQTPDKGVQIGPEPPISDDSIAMTPDKGVQIGKELPIIDASTALTPDKGVQIGPEPPIINASIAMEPDKGVQVGPELPISNDSIAMTSDTVPGFGGNLIEAGIVLNGTKSAVYKSTAYPANADGTQRPGAVVEYSSEFSVGEGIGGAGMKSELPAGYIAADFLESNSDSLIWFAAPSPAKSAEIELDLQYTKTRASQQATCGVAGHTANWAFVPANSTMYSLDTTITGTNALERSVLLFTWQATPDNPDYPGKTSLSTQGRTITKNARITEEATGVAMLNYDNGRWNPYYSYARVWRVRVKVGDWEVKGMPCLNAQGVPVMYDTNSKTDYAQTKGNNFIAGFTLSQALQLSNLPTTGGTLTISLPEGYDSNAGVMAALETARSKGWTLTIQTYTPENATETASTFALRRIWVRKTQNENGAYVDTDDIRWQVDWCVDMITPDGSTPDAHGYEMFRNVEAAVAYWELTPYVDPEAEQEFSQEL